MDLGIAKERLAAGQDPQQAVALVTRAHDEAKQAIGELRDLVRGIHPQVLTDRGLDAALSALAARSTVPVTVGVDLPWRLPPATEAAAYFVVAESLTNVAKHSGASRASVRVEQSGPRLMIDIRDDGRGGAIEHGAEMVAALDDASRLLEAVREHQPDLVIVDVRMPPTFTDVGLRAAVELRSVLPGTPVLVL